MKAMIFDCQYCSKKLKQLILNHREISWKIVGFQMGIIRKKRILC